MQAEVFAQCGAALAARRRVSIDDIAFEAPKGFSSFTPTVRAKTRADSPSTWPGRRPGRVPVPAVRADR